MTVLAPAPTLAFTVDAYSLKSALATVKDAMTRSHYLPVLDCVRLDYAGGGLSVTATDHETTISVSIDATGSGDGSMVVHHSTLSKLVADVKKADKLGVRISQDGDDVNVVCDDGAVGALPATAVENFPKRPDFESLGAEIIDMAALIEVASIAGVDETRPILTGVHVHNYGGGACIVATDSYRLNLVSGLPEIDGLPSDGILFPAKLVKLLAKTKAATVSMSWSDRHIRFRVGNVKFMTRLIEGQFPNYRTLVPVSQPGAVLVDDPAEFVAAAKYLDRFNEAGLPLRVTADGDRLLLTVTPRDTGRFSRTIRGSVTGLPGKFELGLNSKYAQSFLAGQPKPTMIGVTDSLKPVTIRTPLPDGGEVTRLLMPIRT